MWQRSASTAFAVLLVATAFVPLAAASAGGPTASAPAAGQPARVATSGPPAPAAAVDASATAPQAGEAPPDDPESDRIGWEGGYWHNESIDVDQRDGLSDQELDAFVSRAMARVEYIRDREFKSDVPVAVMTREEYRNRSSSGAGTTGAFGQWNNQVWEALFVVGEDTDVQKELAATSGSAVAGFYSPTNDRITIITPNPDEFTISPATLVHELVHALQDQYVNLSAPKYYQGVDGTQDAGLAVSGVVEGEANYVEARWDQRCGGSWSCVAEPSGGGGGGGGINQGILYTIYHPYADGPHWVAEIVDEEGWDGFERYYDDIPQSTEQIIHLTDDEPVPIDYTDNASNGWSTFPAQGVGGADRTGEASMFVMFWHNGIVSYSDISSGTQSRYDQLDYAAEPSAGWGNDKVFPYRRGSGEDAEYGYVWVTKWDTREDAREFREAYLELVTGYPSERLGENTWRITEGSYADAFHVVRDGKTVTIVNAPEQGDLRDIRPSIEFAAFQATPTPTPYPWERTSTATTTAAETSAASGETAATPTENAAETTTVETGVGTPGLGVVAALAALALAALGLRRGRR
jgi:hypothetical protein